MNPLVQAILSQVLNLIEIAVQAEGPSVLRYLEDELIRNVELLIGYWTCRGPGTRSLKPEPLPVNKQRRRHSLQPA
jgi:hypothetical protein